MKISPAATTATAACSGASRSFNPADPFALSSLMSRANSVASQYGVSVSCTASSDTVFATFCGTADAAAAASWNW